jgi:hypothetical protein
MATATVAQHNTLQQRAAAARHAGSIGIAPNHIVGQPFLMGHEFSPIASTGLSQTNRPVLNGDRGRPSTARTWPIAARILPPPVIDVSTSIPRVIQDLQHPNGVRLSSNDLVRRRPNERPYGQLQVGAPECHGDRTLESAELVEHKSEPRLHFFVRVQDNGTAAH